MKTLEIIANSANYKLGTIQNFLAKHAPTQGACYKIKIKNQELLKEAFLGDEDDSSVIWQLAEYEEIK